MLYFTTVSTQIAPKCAGEVLNKAREALPGFSGFSTPVLHLCFWKTDVHPRDLDLDWESKTLLKAWCDNFGLAQRSQELVSAPLEAENSIPSPGSKEWETNQGVLHINTRHFIQIIPDKEPYVYAIEVLPWNENLFPFP